MIVHTTAGQLTPKHLRHRVTLDGGARIWLARLGFKTDPGLQHEFLVEVTGSNKVTYPLSSHAKVEVEMPDVDGPVFSTRATVTDGEPEGIVVTVDGKDLVGIFPSADDEPTWELGYWWAGTGEWVEVETADPFDDVVTRMVASDGGF